MDITVTIIVGITGVYILKNITAIVLTQTLVSLSLEN